MSNLNSTQNAALTVREQCLIHLLQRGLDGDQEAAETWLSDNATLFGGGEAFLEQVRERRVTDLESDLFHLTDAAMELALSTGVGADLAMLAEDADESTRCVLRKRLAGYWIEPGSGGEGLITDAAMPRVLAGTGTAPASQH